MANGQTTHRHPSAGTCLNSQAEQDMYQFILGEGHSVEEATAKMNHMRLANGYKGNFQPAVKAA